MSDSDETTVPANADALPRHTTPTWEVELLISGVAVFAMLQLPGWLDDRWFALRPRLDASWADPLLVIYIYAKSAALLLAATFVVHLLLRARWIAQVGMHSVHPEGIRWERLRMGPVQREVDRLRYGNAEASIDRADNRATTVFAIGVMLASLLMAVSVVLLLVYSLAHWVAQRTGVELDASNALLLIIAVLVLPMALAIRLDRGYGARLAAGGFARRWLARIFVLYGWLGFGQGANPTVALIASHGGRLRIALTTLVIVALATTAALSSYSVERDPARLGQYALFPQFAPGSAQVVDAAHYEDTRNPDRDEAVPYVQSAVVTGPYLKLVVPYRPMDDGVALHRDCPGIAVATPALQAQATLACLQRLHALLLDGRPLDPNYATGSDARTDRPALIAMIDIRALAAGRHVLQVAHAAIGDDKTAAATASPYRIAFWR